ncbi:MAG: hypothetical protein ABIH11_04580 [Candidatus Altiarchaeota archaeon]
MANGGPSPVIEASKAALAAYALSEDKRQKMRPDEERRVIERDQRLEPYEFVNDPARMNQASALFAARGAILDSLQQNYAVVKANPNSPEAQVALQHIQSLTSQLGGNKGDFESSLSGSSTSAQTRFKSPTAVDRAAYGVPVVGSALHSAGVIHPAGVRQEVVESTSVDVDTTQFDIQQASAEGKIIKAQSRVLGPDGRPMTAEQSKTLIGVDGKPLTGDIEVVQSKIVGPDGKPVSYAEVQETVKRTGVASDVLSGTSSSSDLTQIREEVGALASSGNEMATLNRIHEATYHTDGREIVEREVAGEVSADTIAGAGGRISDTVDGLRGEDTIRGVEATLGTVKRRIQSAVAAEREAISIQEQLKAGQVSADEARSQLSAHGEALSTDTRAQVAEVAAERTRLRPATDRESVEADLKLERINPILLNASPERKVDLADTVDVIENPRQLATHGIRKDDIPTIATMSMKADVPSMAIVGAAVQMASERSTEDSPYYAAEMIHQANSDPSARSDMERRAQNLKSEMVFRRQEKPKTEEFMDWLDDISERSLKSQAA